MWNSLEIKLLCRDQGNDYEVSVYPSLHAHISLSNATTTTTTSFNKCIKLIVSRFYSTWHKSEISKQRLDIRTSRGLRKAIILPDSFCLWVWEKHRTKFLTQALSLSSAYHRDTKLTLFLETSRLGGLSVRSMYYSNTPTTFYFMSK